MVKRMKHDILNLNLLFISSWILDKKENIVRTKKEYFEQLNDISLLRKQIRKKLLPPTIEEIFGNHIPTEQEIINKLGNKWKNTIESISYIISYFSFKNWKNAVSFYISTTNPYFLKNIGSVNQISLVLKKCIDFGLIKVKNEYYHFGSSNHSDNKCRTYYWNSNVSQVIESIMKKNGIRKKAIRISDYGINKKLLELNKVIEEKKLNSLEKYRNKLYVKEHTNINLDDDTAILGLRQNYEPFDEYHLIMENYNSLERNHNNVEKFIFNLPRAKNNNIKKISIRGTSNFCCIESENRKSMLEDLFDGFYCNDVNGSIFRNTYLLNTGEWLDDSIDMYEYICGFKLDFETRNAVKTLCMICYFSPSLQKAESSLCYSKDKENNIFKYLYESNYNGMKDSFRWFYRNLKEKLGGRLWGSEIFFHETCNYIGVKKNMIDRGLQVYRVYDGFYTDKNLSASEFNNIVKTECLRYFNKYKDWIIARRKMIDDNVIEENIKEETEKDENIHQKMRDFIKTFDKDNKDEKNAITNQSDKCSETLIEDKVKNIENDKKFNIEHLNNVKIDFLTDNCSENFFSSS